MMPESVLNDIWPFILCTGLVTLNEMGDKSQFLAMAFAARMKLSKVLLGIFLAVVALGTIAVAVGSLLASVPGWQSWVQLFSSLLFLIFGLWTLKGEGPQMSGPQKGKRSYGDVAVAFTSFFFSEMGDKTQLVTISLAARYPFAPLLVLAGTTLGMMLADGIGIFAGVIAHKRLPERRLKVISAAFFIFFGIFGVWQSLHDNFQLSAGVSFFAAAVAAVITIYAGNYIYRKSEKIL